MTQAVQKVLRNKESGTTDKGLERARAILDSAGELFSSQGYAGLSMRAVAARVGVSLSVVQHYYKSKDEMLEALLLYIMDSYQAAIAEVVSSMVGAARIDQFHATMDTLLDAAQDSSKTGSLM